jgi:predicted nucleic acid-binding Zn ribbon protein
MSSNLRIKRICAWCGKEFIAQKTTTACCSKQCANALYKKRKRDEAIKANNQIVEKKIEEKPIERIKDKPFLTTIETPVSFAVEQLKTIGVCKTKQ